MPPPTDPEENFEDASSRLDEGLKSCRAVVSGYRALLAGEDGDDAVPGGFSETGDPGDEAAV